MGLSFFFFCSFKDASLFHSYVCGKLFTKKSEAQLKRKRKEKGFSFLLHCLEISLNSSLSHDKLGKNMRSYS